MAAAFQPAKKAHTRKIYISEQFQMNRCGLLGERWAEFVIGGAVALQVEILLFPDRARYRLLESLSASIKQA